MVCNWTFCQTRNLEIYWWDFTYVLTAHRAHAYYPYRILRVKMYGMWYAECVNRKHTFFVSFFPFLLHIFSSPFSLVFFFLAHKLLRSQRKSTAKEIFRKSVEIWMMILVIDQEFNDLWSHMTPPVAKMVWQLSYAQLKLKSLKYVIDFAEFVHLAIDHSNDNVSRTSTTLISAVCRTAVIPFWPLESQYKTISNSKCQKYYFSIDYSMGRNWWFPWQHTHIDDRRGK